MKCKITKWERRLDHHAEHGLVGNPLHQWDPFSGREIDWWGTWKFFDKGLASYCLAKTTFTFHSSILTLSNAFLSINNREGKSDSGFSLAMASQPFGFVGRFRPKREYLQNAASNNVDYDVHVDSYKPGADDFKGNGEDHHEDPLGPDPSHEPVAVSSSDNISVTNINTIAVFFRQNG